MKETRQGCLSYFINKFSKLFKSFENLRSLSKRLFRQAAALLTAALICAVWEKGVYTDETMQSFYGAAFCGPAAFHAAIMRNSIMEHHPAFGAKKREKFAFNEVLRRN